MNYEWEISRNGFVTQVAVKEVAYGNVEVTYGYQLVDANLKGGVVANKIQTFYTRKEFVEFFGPIVNTLKKEIDNGIGS